VPEITRLLTDNEAYVPNHEPIADPRPSRRLAVVTCMDARIDVFAALGLRLGEVHVLRNAGGRVTDDVLRSLALSTHVLGVEEVVLMQHTRCGLAGATDAELQTITGAGVRFLAIENSDHKAALDEDIATLAATTFLSPVRTIAGLVFDVDTGAVTEYARWERPGAG
jgi:carbonic anhydrase